MTLRCMTKMGATNASARLGLLAVAILLPAAPGFAETAAPGDGVAQAVRTVASASPEADPAFEGRIGCASIDLAGNRGIADEAGLGTALTLTKASVADAATAGKAI